jgi:hypothetical protein
VGIPPGRALLARVANTAPALTQRLAPGLLRKGMARQEKIKRQRGI